MLNEKNYYDGKYYNILWEATFYVFGINIYL